MKFDNLKFGDLEIKSAEIYLENENGKKVMGVSDVPIVEYEYNKKYKSLHFNPCMEISIDSNMLGIDIIKNLGIDATKIPNACDISYAKLVQKRKHKKKRINKKWFKKYGLKQVIVETKGWEIRTGTDGTFEFFNRNAKEFKKIIQ